MKLNAKKGLALVLVGAMALSMVGCGGKDGAGKGSSKKKDASDEDIKNMIYSQEDFVIEGIEGDISNCIVKGDKLYIQTYEWIEGGSADNTKPADDKDETGNDADDSSKDETTEEKTEETTEAKTEETTEAKTEENDNDSSEGNDDAQNDTEEKTDDGDSSEEYVDGTSIERFYCANIDGSNLQEIKLPDKSENEYMNSMEVDDEGNLYYIYSLWNEKTEQSTYRLIKADTEGKTLADVDLNKLLKITNDTYFSGINMGSEGNLAICSDQSVYVLDSDLQLLGEVKTDGYIGAMALSKDGQFLCGMEDYSNSGEDSGAVVKVLDVKNLKWGDSYKIDIRYFNGNDSIMKGEGYDFYYKDETAIYGYDMNSKSGTKIFDFLASDVSSDNTYNIKPFGEDSFIGMSYDDQGAKLVCYKKVDPSTVKDKTTITVGMPWIDYELKNAAVEFNKNNDQYRVELKDYSNEEDPFTKMNADFVAGNVPDIICLSTLPYEKYISKGMLEDLTPYFDKDPDLNMDDLLPSVAEAMKTDGKPYFVSPTFNVSSLVASSKLVGTEPGWTFKEMIDLIKSQGNDVRPFYWNTKNEMLNTFLWGIGNDFVDWQTGECRYDSQDFKDILELCNTGVNDEGFDYESNGSEPELIGSGKVLFENANVGLDEIQLYKKMFRGDITFIGFPNEKKDGSYFSFGNPMAMYSKSDVKDGAWEFMRVVLSKEYQTKYGNYRYQIPTRQDAFDMMITARTATKAYKDEAGNEIQPYESSWGWDDLNVDIGPSSEEDVAMFKELINNTHRVSSYSNELSEIISEEAKAYFSGDKTVDETANIIQNRVKTYVNENR